MAGEPEGGPAPRPPAGADLLSEFINADGPIQNGFFTSDHIHLSLAGHVVFAEGLRSFVRGVFRPN